MRKLRYDSPICHAREFILSHMDEVRSSGSYQLLSERELAQAASISRVTVRNALKELVRQGYIVNLPKKGNFIDKRIVPPRHTVGIIRDDGSEADYHADFIELLTDILGVMNENHCAVKFVTSPNLLNKSHILFPRYGLDGMIWVSPPDTMYCEIKESGMSPDQPIVSIIISDMFRIPLSGNYVSMDYEGIGKIRAEFFLNRGHRNVAYIGNSGITHDSFRKTFLEAGVEIHQRYQIEQINDIQSHLPQLLEKKEVTAIVSNGPRIRLEEVFHVLSAFPGRDGIELLVDWIPELPELMNRYPLVRVDATARKKQAESMSVAAAEMMIRALKERKQQPPLLIEYSISKPTAK